MTTNIDSVFVRRDILQCESCAQRLFLRNYWRERRGASVQLHAKSFFQERKKIQIATRGFTAKQQLSQLVKEINDLYVWGLYFETLWY